MPVKGIKTYLSGRSLPQNMGFVDWDLWLWVLNLSYLFGSKLAPAIWFVSTLKDFRIFILFLRNFMLLSVFLIEEY